MRLSLLSLSFTTLLSMKIYLISGLGVDQRAFKNLEFPFPSQFIQWVTPDKTDTLVSYSHKLINQIDTSEEVILVGVSFGGMISQEIAKVIRCKKVIIISSIKHAGEMNWQLRLVQLTRIDKLLPARLFKFINLLTGPVYFGLETKEERILLRNIIRDTDNHFMKWAISAILTWKNSNPLDNIIHIHGTHDRVLSPRNIKNYIPVSKAGHFMNVNRAKEINSILRKHLLSNSEPLTI
jgi:pimeloyl-ACP methyl ester carboxylesterase